MSSTVIPRGPIVSVPITTAGNGLAIDASATTFGDITIPSGTRATRLHARGKAVFASEAVTFIYARPNNSNTNCASRHVEEGTGQAISDLAVMVSGGTGRVQHDFEFWLDLQTGVGRRFFRCESVTFDASAPLKAQFIAGGYNDDSTAITSVRILNPFAGNFTTLKVRADLIFEPR